MDHGPRGDPDDHRAGAPAPAGYWYDGADPAVAMLEALRRLRAADQAVRRTASHDMAMNTTDIEALRHVVVHERRGDPVTAHGLGDHLGIAGPSITKLVDRLVASGHLRRAAHPRDGRSRIILATDQAHAQMRARLGPMHRRMLEIAREVPPGSRADVRAFLLAMAEEIEAQAER